MSDYNTFMADQSCSACDGHGWIGFHDGQQCPCVKVTEMKITQNMSDTDKQKLLHEIETFINHNPNYTKSVHEYLSEKALQELHTKIAKSQVPPDPELDQIISSNIQELYKHGFTESDKNCVICGGSGFIDNGTYNCVCTDAFKPISSTSDPDFKQKMRERLSYLLSNGAPHLRLIPLDYSNKHATDFKQVEPVVANSYIGESLDQVLKEMNIYDECSITALQELLQKRDQQIDWFATEMAETYYSDYKHDCHKANTVPDPKCTVEFFKEHVLKRSKEETHE